MSVLDLFTGTWTWGALTRDVLAVVIPAVGAFWAGYWTGRLREQRDIIDWLEAAIDRADAR